MAKIGDTHYSETTKQTFYYHDFGDRKGWNTEPVTEDELVSSGISRGERAGGGYGKDEIGKTVTKRQKENEQDLVRNTLMSLVGGGAQAGAASLLGPNAGGKIVIPVIKALTARLAGAGAGAATSEGIARLQGREDVNSILDSTLDQGFDAALQGGINTAKFLSSPGKNIREGVTRFAGKLGKLSDAEQSTMESMGRLHEDFGMPFPAASVIKGAPTSFLGENAKTESRNQLLRTQSASVEQAIPDFNTRSQKSPSEFTTEYKNNAIRRKSVAQARNRAAHENFESIADSVQITANPPVAPNPNSLSSLFPAQSGPVTISGPVAINRATEFVTKMTEALTELKTTGALNAESERSIGQLEGLFSGIANAPIINGQPILPYKVVKQIRGSLDHLKDTFPPVDTRKRQLVGTANKLIASLSRDTGDSVQFWGPQAQLAHEEARAATQDLASQFNPKKLRTMVAGEDYGNSVRGADLDVDEESLIMNALKSYKGTQILRRGAGPDYDQKISSMFVKIGYDKAYNNETGLYDGDKLNQYFKDPKNLSILESDVVTTQQRRQIKDFINYTRNFSKAAPEKVGGGLSYKQDRMLRGALTFGVGAGGMAAAGGSLPIAAATGLGLTAVLPIGERFLESVLLHPEGGKIIQQMIYAPSTQTKMAAKQKLLEFAIKNGVKTFIRYESQDGTEQEQEIN